ncbi:hypothetical protein HQQ94_03485 [Shewanella sp. VB17]|uniref:hypothetical protein n=1 Tax=Shewanella sp. VB17 TaxID=2739432 RepID=UPI001564A0D6|nr:hypothetical protein [Shewanella sp. VB17]NRD72318.1 hypothetical protein [Shewanella sp. VB17]
MKYYFRQFTHKIAISLIAVVLLQFAGANIGAHQLHLGNSEEKSENHPHLEFTAEITSLAQCLGCDNNVQTNIESFSTDTSQSLVQHNHLASKTETKTFDLCLDCQCHGGHVTAMSMTAMVPSIPNSDEVTSSIDQYLPPEAIPDYRPPIV